jgi:hypothetical protein
MDGWCCSRLESSEDKVVDREEERQRTMETGCWGSQGSPRAVAPRVRTTSRPALRPTESPIQWVELELLLHHTPIWPAQRQFTFLYSFFWLIPRRLNCICRRFGTPCPSIFTGRVRVPHDLWRWKHRVFWNVGKLNSDDWESPPKKEYDIQNTTKVCNQEI